MTLTSVVELEELAEEEGDAIFEEFLRQVLAALFTLANDSGESSLCILEDALDFVLVRAEGALHGQARDRAIS